MQQSMYDCVCYYCFTLISIFLLYKLFFRTTVEQLQNEINALDTRIKKVHKQIDLSSTEKEIKGQMTEFLQVYNL